MAFDQATRGRLQRFVNDARRVLEEEFTRQLQNDYGMDPNAGTMAELASLRHINDAQRETARILRDTLAHYTAGGDMSTSQGLDRIVREQAFTVLNRLAALRMAEARGLLVESVDNGLQAKGFQLYARLAGAGLGETGDAYRAYLFSIFDEFAQDLPGLFDRFSPQGRLFPREAALLQVLHLINDAEIAYLWGEDETIGWIYQYFNSKEERKAMRDASQAPRNSRELAVRNQFFTPRYVVEFLVDNTLGRLWFNATAGKTGLRERCNYLLVNPDEAPLTAPHVRDPRSLKLLDPACGSMHFGLYAFDLFADIYREAWQWEQQNGPGSLAIPASRQAELKPLSQTYADEQAFLLDVPRLIVEHNIFGVDIDPRAAQIASLALWLRAQRAWHKAGIKAKDRPSIARGQVIAAVAPPAERELRRGFAANLDKRDAELFEQALQMLKGLPELGVLLQAERELAQLIRNVYLGRGTGLFARQEQEAWQQAETRLRAALSDFAHAAKSSYQSRLFALDAIQGLRLIELCREKFDVVVMNPPFGLAAKALSQDLKRSYPDGYVDLFACFVCRAVELCVGWVGVISSRSMLISKKLERLREQWVVPRLETVLDLGWPVMDDATVQSAAYTLNCSSTRSTSSLIAIDRKPYAVKDDGLLAVVSGDVNSPGRFHIERQLIHRMPRARVLYNLPSRATKLLTSSRRVGGNILLAKLGMKSFRDFRFLRARHEVMPSQIGKGRRWVPLAKGGPFATFYSDLPLVLNWADDGREVCEINRIVNGQTAQARQASVYYYKRGGTYSRRSKDFGVRVLPDDFIIGEKGPAVLPVDCSPMFVVGLLNANLFRALINLQANAKQYDSGLVDALPLVEIGIAQRSEIESAADSAVVALRQRAQRTEADSLFVCPDICMSLGDAVGVAASRDAAVSNAVAQSLVCIDRVIDGIYGVDSGALQKIVRSETVGVDDDEAEGDESDEEESEEAAVGCAPAVSASQVAAQLFSYAFGCAMKRWEVRFASGELAFPQLSDHFDALPQHPPGMLLGPDGALEAEGLLVDEEGSAADVVQRIEDVLKIVWRDRADAIEQELVSALGVGSLREYLRRVTGFFAEHLSVYTKGKRKAPVYWPLSTVSGSYTVWVHYLSLTSQTLYTAVNEFVEPKLKQVGEQFAVLRAKGSIRTREEERQFEALQSFYQELIELRDALLRLAPTYKPNHDDGVQINAAPLWSLFRHKPWQKLLKDTWTKLEKGEYDWAHMAMNYWPERVRERCKTDKSLAIAHGLESLYVEPEVVPKKTRGKKKGAEA